MSIGGNCHQGLHVIMCIWRSKDNFGDSVHAIHIEAGSLLLFLSLYFRLVDLQMSG